MLLVGLVVDFLMSYFKHIFNFDCEVNFFLAHGQPYWSKVCACYPCERKCTYGNETDTCLPVIH